MSKRKYLLNIALVVLVVLMCMFGWLEYKRSRALNELAALGYPVTPEAMLKYYHEVPDEENAWTLLEGLNEKIQYPPEGEFENLPIIGDAEWNPAEGPMTTEMRRASEKMLELNAEVLETIHEAARRPFLRVPGKVTEEGYLKLNIDVDAFLSESYSILGAIRLLRLERCLATEEGNPDAAARSIISGLRVAILRSQQPKMGAILDAHVTFAVVIDGLEGSLLVDVKDELLVEIQTELETLIDSTPHDIDVALNLAFWMLSREEGNTPTVYPFSRLLNALLLWEDVGGELYILGDTPVSFLSQRYPYIFSRYDYLKHLRRLENANRDEMLNAYNSSIGKYSGFLWDIHSIMVLGMEKTSLDLHIHHLAMGRFGQLAVALKRYKLHHGAYPPHLSSLVPEFIEDLPQVPMVGKDWEYTVGESGCVLECDLGLLPARELLRIELKAE